jgi:molecular chaperone GrpE (heat shock protein)
VRTQQEHKQRKIFMTKYLRQHYDIIKMYINWLKPYLRNVQKLNMKGVNMSSPDIVSAFEGSMLDVEILARIKAKDIKVKGEKVEEGWHCVLVTFNYRTRPELKVVQEGYQRGPVHIGKLELNIRAYHWVKADIDNYKKLKNAEIFELIGDISGTVKESMEALGDELKNYLEEKPEKEEEKKEEEKPSFAQKFFGDFYTPKAKKKEQPNAKAIEAAIEKHRAKGGSAAMFYAFLTYNTFKKAHRMITW